MNTYTYTFAMLNKDIVSTTMTQYQSTLTSPTIALNDTNKPKYHTKHKTWAEASKNAFTLYSNDIEVLKVEITDNYLKFYYKCYDVKICFTFDPLTELVKNDELRMYLRDYIDENYIGDKRTMLLDQVDNWDINSLLPPFHITCILFSDFPHYKYQSFEE